MTKPDAGLAALETRLRQDLSWLELPARTGSRPPENGQPVLDVAIIGGGTAGLAASRADAPGRERAHLRPVARRL